MNCVTIRFGDLFCLEKALGYFTSSLLSRKLSKRIQNHILRAKNEVQSIFGLRHLTHLSHQIFTRVFCLFFAKFLTSEPRRKFSTHVMMMFWVLKTCSRMRAIQRTLNQGHITRRKSCGPPILIQWQKRAPELAFDSYFSIFYILLIFLYHLNL